MKKPSRHLDDRSHRAPSRLVKLESPPPRTSLPHEQVTVRPEQIEFIRNRFEDPATMVLNMFSQGARLVGLGKMHNDRQMIESAVAIVTQAADRGLVHFIALEVQKENQGIVDEFQRTGLVSEDLQKRVLYTKAANYLQILETARAKQLQILCVDEPRIPLREQQLDAKTPDEIMGEAILAHMGTHLEQRGFFIGGGNHMARFKGNIIASSLQNAYAAVLLQTEASAILDEVYSAYISSGIKEPAGLSNIRETPFRNSPYITAGEHTITYGDIFDGVILLPPF